MTHPNGGFYSALDADSEGVEGKFYIWTQDEFREIIGNGWESAADYYQITSDGNWEHGHNILYVLANPQRVLSDYGLTEPELESHMQSVNARLLAARSNRIPPGLDDKVILGWNAMMITGLTDAYRVLADPMFLNLALTNIAFLEGELQDGGKFYRTFKDKRSQTEAFLEDYAFLIQAYNALYQVTFSESWINKAAQWCEHVLS